MNIATLKTYSDFLQQFLNNPCNYTESNQIQQAIGCLKELCSNRAQLQIKFIGIWQCTFCFHPININSQKYYELSCGHCSHQECIDKVCVQKDPNLDLEKLIGIHCNICGYELKTQEAYNGVGKTTLEKIHFQQALKIDQQFAEENKKIAETKTFECAICMDDQLSVNKECITLECDHRTCKDCLADYLAGKIETAQVSATDLVCPNSSCKQPIAQAIIKYVVSQEIFDKYINFGFNKFEPLSENQIFVRCPTVYMHFIKLFLKTDCKMIFEYDKTMSETRFTCPICSKKFCALGCDDPHEGSTCEQYKQWKIENGQADQAFDLVIQQEKIRKCPFCGAYVLRTQGCNHMTCICKKEFCYVCGGIWVGRKCGHSYYGS